MNSFYLSLKSDASRNYYTANTVSSFKNKLLNNINLEGEWEVALCDLQFFKHKKIASNRHSFWIYSDIVIDTQVGDLSLPLLRRASITNSRKNWLMYEANGYLYRKLKTNFIESISISIKDSLNHFQDTLHAISTSDTTEESPTTLTLHFRKIT